jgi:RNA polymerase sigma factor (sigma-70 family)
MTDSRSLLADYAKSGSEAAFHEVVRLYIDLVYSTAVRLVGNDADLAKDVAQTVFIALARKAGSLPSDVMLGGWLHRHTVFVASTLMRGARRRHVRERQAAEMNAIQDHTPDNLAQIAPILDEAIDQLAADDRQAILLRFFEQREFRSVGELLGSTEEAARKRVARSLEKLQLLLKRRGVSLSVAALATALATEAVTAAPAGFAATVGGAALATVGAGGVSLTLLKVITMAKLKVAIVSVLVAGSIIVPLTLQRQALVQVRQDNQALQQQLKQITTLETENARLANLLAQARSEPEAAQGSPAELLRLRGELGVLRRQLQDARRDGAARVPGIAHNPAELGTEPLPLEYQMRTEGRHWVQTPADITAGSLVQETHAGYRVLTNLVGQSDIPADAGTLGRVLSIGTDDRGQQTAVVDFGGGFTKTNHLFELAAVSDAAAPDSIEGLLRAQGQQWAPAPGTINAGDWVEDILDGRHNQPESRGAIGRVIFVSADETNPPAAMVDFGRGYTVGLALTELSRVSLAPK